MKEHAWAIVDPDGHVVADSTWKTEEDAWQAQADLPRGQGRFAEDDFDAAKAAGWRAVRVRLVEVGPV